MCREAGARVTMNTFLRDLNIDHISPRDSRRIEVIANGLPLWSGAQLAVDSTIVSPLGRDGSAHPGAATTDGISLERARQTKGATYPELCRGHRARPVVFAIEVGGRWSKEALCFVRLLAQAKCRATPSVVRSQAARSWADRWSTQLAVAAQTAFAASLLELPLSAPCIVDGAEPSLGELLVEGRWHEAPSPSRLPAR